jgi:hypothetical protein
MDSDPPFRKIVPKKPIEFPEPVPTIQYDSPIGPVQEPQKGIGEQFLDAVGEFNRVVTGLTQNKVVKGAHDYAANRSQAIDQNFGIGEGGFGSHQDYGDVAALGSNWMNIGAEWMPPAQEPPHPHRHRRNRKR